MEARTLSEIVQELEARPTEMFVVREEFLEEIGVTAGEISEESGRVHRRVVEIFGEPIRKMDFRDRVVWFAPKVAV
jgi:hypothetical protein